MTTIRCPRCGEALEPVAVTATVTTHRCRYDGCGRVNHPGTLRGWLARLRG